MVAAFGFWALRSGHFGPGVRQRPGARHHMAAAVLVGVLGELLVFRPLRTSSPLAKLVASSASCWCCSHDAAVVRRRAAADPQRVPGPDRRGARQLDPCQPLLDGRRRGADHLALGALFRWTRFGLATRAAAENEITAMLRGLSPNQLSMANTVLASAIAGAMGIIAAPLSQADSVTLVLFVGGPRGALFAGFSSLWIAAVAGFAIGIGQSLMTWVATAAVVPDRQGQSDARRAGPAHVRGADRPVGARARLPSRPVSWSKAPAVAPRPRAWPHPASGRSGAVLLIVLPFSYRQALMVSMVGMVCLLAGGDHRIRRPGVARQVTLAGVAGFAVAVDRQGRHRIPWGPLVGSAAAVVIGLVVGVSGSCVAG